jgi:hypothetical protein
MLLVRRPCNYWSVVRDGVVRAKAQESACGALAASGINGRESSFYRADARTTVPSLTTTGRTVAAILLCILVLAASTVPLGAATYRSTAGDIPIEQGERGAVLAQQQNNSTVQHENPNTVNTQDNLSSVSRWLSGRLTQTMINCTNGLSVRRFDACERFENKSPEWLGKYVEVNREDESRNNGGGGSNGSNNTSKSFERAQENQTRLISTVRKYNRTLTEYRQARANGNTQRARELSRRLLELSEQTRNVSANLTANYRAIENISGQNTTGAVRTLNETTENITTRVRTISTAQFVNTTLTVNTSSQRISFRRPLSVNGRLTLDNGTPIANQTIVLQAGNSSQRVTTNASGGFSFIYRPTSVSLGRQTVTIRYVPADRSPYRSDETTIPVNIEQVTPRINATVRPDEAGANDTMTVAGRVSANGVGVPSVPIVASIDGQRLEAPINVTTTAEGRFQTTFRLPADVPTGTQPLRLSLPFEGRALANTTVSKSITITPTATTLSVRAPETHVVNQSGASDREIPVTGRLTTTDNTSISNRSVALQIDGTTVGEARTGPNGTYTTNITIPSGALRGQGEAVSVTITAVYDGQRTSFAPSRAEAGVKVVAPAEGLVEQFMATFSELPLSYRVLFGVSVLFVGTALVYPLGRRLFDGLGDQSDGQLFRDVGDLSGDASPSEAATGSPAAPSLFDVARQRLVEGDSEGAIVAAYASVRERLSATFGFGSTQTHWEFLAACRERALGERQLAALDRITEAYERAAFGPQESSEETASEALENAQQLTGDSQTAESQSEETR